MIAATSTQNEQQMLHQLTQGNFYAFEQLFKNYYAPLCHHALSFSGDAATAEDAVSDVFARIWEKRSQLNIDTSVKSYLYRAVSNQCIDILRKSYRKRVVLTDDLNSHACTPDSACISAIPETRELAVKIELAVRSLPKQCGIIFRMSREAGLKYHEIAGQLGISIKTVETQMGRAFKSLRAALLTPGVYA
jgi:RNA polymerase sigma-70 factor, ECF subfamily